VGPFPHNLKFYHEILTSETVTYLLCGDSVSAWNADLEIHSSQLRSKSFDISSSLLISAELENGTLNTTACTSLGVVRRSNAKASIHLPLQKNETCFSLVQQNNLAIVSTSTERLFAINAINSSFKELINSASGPSMLSGLTRYASSFIWEDRRRTVSLTRFDSGILHLTSTHAHIWDLVEEDDISANNYQIRQSMPVLTIISKASQKPPAEISLLHAKFYNEILYVLALVGKDYMLYTIVENRATTQVHKLVCRTISKEEASVSLLLEPIKICENEIYILFKDRIHLSYVGDFKSKPISLLLEKHIFGSMELPRSVLFYTADGIWSRNRKEASEKNEFHDILQGFMADSSVLNKEFLKPFASFPPARVLELV
jgi:hypothetical protein